MTIQDFIDDLNDQQNAEKEYFDSLSDDEKAVYSAMYLLKLHTIELYAKGFTNFYIAWSGLYEERIRNLRKYDQ